MKKIMLIILLMAFAISGLQCQSYGDVVIGRLESGEPVITLSESRIKTDWEDLLEDDDINVDFSEFGIVDMGTYYLLIGIDETNVVVKILQTK